MCSCFGVLPSFLKGNHLGIRRLLILGFESSVFSDTLTFDSLNYYRAHLFLLICVKPNIVVSCSRTMSCRFRTGTDGDGDGSSMLHLSSTAARHIHMHSVH